MLNPSNTHRLLNSPRVKVKSVEESGGVGGQVGCFDLDPTCLFQDDVGGGETRCSPCVCTRQWKCMCGCVSVCVLLDMWEADESGEIEM